MKKALRLLGKIMLAFVGVITLAVLVTVAFYHFTLYKAGDEQQGYMALTGAMALIGEDLDVLPEATILVRDGIIEKIGSAQQVLIPPQAQVIDLDGYTIMPGLVDLHVHFGGNYSGKDPGIAIAAVDWFRFFPGTRRSFLENGVTTVRDLGNEFLWITDLRHKVQSGELESPNIFISGPIFTTQGGHPVTTLGIDPASNQGRIPRSPDEAMRMVSELAAGGNRVDCIKIVQERGKLDRPLEPMGTDILSSIVQSAHHEGLPVIAHWGTLKDLEEVLAAGVDEVHHLEPRGGTQKWPEEIINTMLEGSVTLSPTLSVTEKPIPTEVHEQLRNRVGEFYAAGGKIAVSTDAPLQGLRFGESLHRELELLVISGLKPRDALKGATGEAAKLLRSKKIGVIEQGRQADLLVVSGNPLQDIKSTQNIIMVFRDGRLVVNNN